LIRNDLKFIDNDIKINNFDVMVTEDINFNIKNSTKSLSNTIILEDLVNFNHTTNLNDLNSKLIQSSPNYNNKNRPGTSQLNNRKYNTDSDSFLSLKKDNIQTTTNRNNIGPWINSSENQFQELRDRIEENKEKLLRRNSYDEEITPNINSYAYKNPNKILLNKKVIRRSNTKSMRSDINIQD